MPRTKTLQTNFAAGELAPELDARQDTDQYQSGARSLRNRRVLIGGGVKRRPGMLDQADLPARPQLAELIVNQTTQYVLAFSTERMDAYLKDNDTGELTASGELTGCPWTAAQVPDLIWFGSGNTLFVVHQDMPPQVISRTGTSAWSRAAYAFATGPASRPEQPYLKVANPDYTLRPSALTGSVTLTLAGTSSAYFTSSHVGTYIRYMSKACLITAVAANGLSVTATVVETLPDTQTLTVGASAKFAVGEVIEQETSAARGIITAIGGATSITVVISDGLIEFNATDDIIGPNATTTVSGAASAGTKAAVTDWDEQLISPVYGYPGCGTLHRNRLLFGGHRTAPDFLIASELNNLYSHNVGDGSDGDAILESVGDAAASRIVQLHSAEQLLVLTDKGPYYVPESATAPFRPSSMAFFKFGSPWPINAGARARPFDNGVLFVSGGLVIKAKPTGNTGQQWEANEVSLLAHHMLSNPNGMAVTSNFADGPERYAVMLNDDGTLAVMQLVEEQRIRNFTPWDTQGEIVSTVALDEHLYAAVVRNIAGNTKYKLELFNQDITLDAAREYAALEDPDIVDRFGSDPVHVVTDDYHLGTLPLTLTTIPLGPYVIGLDYETEIETMPPVVEDQEGAKAGDLMRIVSADVRVIQSARFEANGRSLAAYSVLDDADAAPPRKNGWQKFGFLGWSKDPTVVITQADPLPNDITAIRSTVAY